MKKFCFLFLLLIPAAIAVSQEALVSQTEQYYDFLALQGKVERPTLNYRTLSDSIWNIEPGVTHIWQENNLGKTHRFFNVIDTRIYGPELFMSVNTAAPYGQNDGALWQGKGFNSSLTAGVRFEAYGIEATFKPQISFSQNLSFDYMKPNYSGANYTDKAEMYGYYGVSSIDAPQRFGDEPFFTFDWGDSEIRYSWKTLTVGFGTQPIWLGPAQINPIIHSNNAASYPKLDIGLRKQSIDFLGIHWGDIETRAWWGYLSESDYFDNDSSNDHNLITGFSIAYGVPFLPGLTIGLNRIMLSKWDNMDASDIFTLLWPFMDTGAGSDESDQRASIVLDYLLPAAGLNIYLEWGRNDFSPSLDYVLRYPFHTAGYTIGIKKSLNISDRFKGEILLEVTSLECSQDYDRLISWSSTFYAHHIITQGHTNRGQWLGAGIGTGGNSQYIGFKLYYPKGYGQIFFQRRNPDLDYTMFIDSKAYPEDFKNNIFVAERNIRLLLDFGISGLYYITENLSVFGQFVFEDEHNPLYNGKSNGDSTHRFNCSFSARVKYSF
ncbi:capsule assembly Wzi family protein [Breznakiella homolactica]|uniref:Capsule assembly protein Wzi n=1 Tax=Breznakiella homolactica TaxID=2798577 RepID=A0A7T7XNW4_9SPIR|nr:capsule assembly Wzi family protein [Breznakiella homolactica]QQO09809.1 capsule assembly Wzi family protein [Breznakiella homolactica]